METMELKLDNGIKKIKVNDLGEFICIDTTDKSLYEKYCTLADNLKKLSVGLQNDLQAAKELQGTDNIIRIARLNIDYIKKFIDEIEQVFGAGTIRKVFHENYENNPDYVPDESALLAFLDGVLPFMEKAFQDHKKSIESKYSASFKGKRTKR